MKQLVCEICGSTDLIKNGGVFVCQTCGCKYSLEEVRRIMSKGSQNIVSVNKAKAVNGNTDVIKNYLDIARNAINADNPKEADNYCNRIIEIDVTNWEAWFIKGKAVGWQSTLANVRIKETISAFSKAIENCPSKDIGELKLNCEKELQNLQKALLSMRIKNFTTNPNEHDVLGLRNDVATIMNTEIRFLCKILPARAQMISVSNLVYVFQINSGVCDAWENVYSNYIGDDNHPNDYNFTRFLEEGDCLIEALKLALTLFDEKEYNEVVNGLKKQIYENMIDIEKHLKDAKSYKLSFDGGYSHYICHKQLADNAKSIRQSYISDWNAKIRYIERKEEEAAKQRIRDYWEEHKDERERLNSEKDKLLSEQKELELKIFELERKKEDVPAQQRINDVQSLIETLVTEKNSLGIFKGKDKKVLQEKIDAAKSEIAKLKKEVEEQQLEFEKKISSINNRNLVISERISEIKKEFEKNR